MKKIYILSLKKNEYLSNLYEILKEFNIESKNLLKNLKDNKPFPVVLDDSIGENFIEKIRDITNFKVEESYSNELEKIDRWGVLSILIFDVIFILSIVEIAFKTADIYNIMLNIITIQKFPIIIVTILKILLVVVLLKGVINITNSTPIGYIFKLHFIGDTKNLVMFLLLPVIGFYMINMGFGKIYELFGLFLIIFFVVSILTAFENLQIKFKKSTNS
ncbi:MAG: hypothetical protein N2Z81_05275 [Hydrogenothermaceae bacterium]|nr:hypothetical protein [Hydrogenothermaceae bacterium]